MNRTLTAADGVTVYFKAIVLNLSMQLVGGIILLIVQGATDLTADGLMTLNFFMMALLQLAFFLAVFLHVKKKKMSLGYPVAPVKWYTAVIAFLFAAVCVVCFIMPAQWFSLLLQKIGFNSSTSLSFSTPLNIVLGALLTCIIAPVFEELVFRGALLGGLIKKFGVVPAVVLSGLCFSLMHMNPEQTVYQFFLGCVCAYFAICSRSVVPSILLHAGNNLIALILEFVQDGISDAETAAPDYPLEITLTFVLLAVGIAAVYFVGRLMLKSEKERRGGLIFALPANSVVVDITDMPQIEQPTAISDAAEDATQSEIAEGATQSEIHAVTEQQPVGEEKTEQPPVKQKRKSVFTPLIEYKRYEDACDEADIKSGKRANYILGKKTHIIMLCLGLGVCVIMWGMTFLMGMLPSMF